MSLNSNHKIHEDYDPIVIEFFLTKKVSSCLVKICPPTQERIPMVCLVGVIGGEGRGERLKLTLFGGKKMKVREGLQFVF